MEEQETESPQEPQSTLKDLASIVQAMYHQWGFKDDPMFIGDVQKMDGALFASTVNLTELSLGIRGDFGLDAKEGELYDYFISLGLKTPEEMTYKIFEELHKYAKEDLIKNPPPAPPKVFKRGAAVRYLGSSAQWYSGQNDNKEFRPLKKTFIWSVGIGDAYIIQHPDGFGKEYFIKGYAIDDGYVSVPKEHFSSAHTLAYIYASHEELDNL